MKDLNTIASRANLRLREVKDLIDHAVKPLASCQEPETLTALLFALGDALEQHGLALERLATQVTELSSTPSPLPPWDVTTDLLPSSIPADEEPESSAYIDNTGMRKARDHARKGDPT